MARISAKYWEGLDDKSKSFIKENISFHDLRNLKRVLTLASLFDWDAIDNETKETGNILSSNIWRIKKEGKSIAAIYKANNIGVSERIYLYNGGFTEVWNDLTSKNPGKKLISLINEIIWTQKN